MAFPNHLVVMALKSAKKNKRLQKKYKNKQIEKIHWNKTGAVLNCPHIQISSSHWNKIGAVEYKEGEVLEHFRKSRRLQNHDYEDKSFVSHANYKTLSKRI